MPTIFDPEPKKQPEEMPKEEAPKAEEKKEAPPRMTLTHAEESINKLLESKIQPVGLFSSYSQHPKGIKFANQEPDEVVILFLRRHFITNVPWIAATLLLLLLPPVFLLILALVPSITVPPGLTTVLIIFYYLITISYAFGNFISWFYNIGVVTQKRIIDLDSHNILSHNTATANFNEIVDVTVHQRGFFQSTFDYGNVNIQTEAIHANFEFDATPKPTLVSDVISDLRVSQKGTHHGNP
jgi:hypothetical protein